MITRQQAAEAFARFLETGEDEDERIVLEYMISDEGDDECEV